MNKELFKCLCSDFRILTIYKKYLRLSGFLLTGESNIPISSVSSISTHPFNGIVLILNSGASIKLLPFKYRNRKKILNILSDLVFNQNEIN